MRHSLAWHWQHHRRRTALLVACRDCLLDAIPPALVAGFALFHIFWSTP